MENKNSNLTGNILITSLLLLLIIAGYISYRSIDWTVLQRLEAQPLILPTQTIASPSATATSSPIKK
ncbi:MAG: hypothetical protein WCG91_02585 [Candidatus Shapirobacteria bacterium]